MAPDRNDLWPSLHAIVTRYTSKIIAKVVIEEACRQCRANPKRLRSEDMPRMMSNIENQLRLFLKSEGLLKQVMADIQTLSGAATSASRAIPDKITLPITNEVDVLTARSATRELCALLGFSYTEETKIATVVSELTRNIVLYAGNGSVTLQTLSSERRGIQVVAEDKGPGIPNLEVILAGRHRSKSGMGLGICGVRNIMDEFKIETGPNTGTRITACKYRM